MRGHRAQHVVIPNDARRRLFKRRALTTSYGLTRSGGGTVQSVPPGIDVAVMWLQAGEASIAVRHGETAAGYTFGGGAATAHKRRTSRRRVATIRRP
jgi:hypothetical protein